MAHFHIEVDESGPMASYTPLEPGEYPLQIIDAQPSNSQNQRRQLQVNYQVEAPHPDAGRKFNEWYSVSAVPKKDGGTFNQLDTIKRLFRAAGANFNIDPQNGAFDFDSDELKGRSIIAELKINEYTGSDGEVRRQNKVRKFSMANGAAEAAATAAPTSNGNGAKPPARPTTMTRPTAAKAVSRPAAPARPQARR